MRTMMTVFAIFFLIVSTADAKPKKVKFSGKLLSYGQLMKLSGAKRVAYLREVGSLLVYMEKSQAKYNLAQNGELEQIKEQFADLMRQMAIVPEAAAAAREIVPSWDSRRREWVCRGRDVMFDDTLGTCVLTSGGNAFSSKDATPLKPVGGCSPENTVAITVTTANGKFDKCIPNSSWEALSRSRQADLRAGSLFAPGERFKLATPDSSKDVTLGAGRHNIDGTLKTAVADATPAPTQAPASASPPRVSAPPIADVKTLPPDATVTALPPNATVNTLPPDVTVKTSPPNGKVLKPVPVQPVQEPEVSARPEPTTPTAGAEPAPKCELPPANCESLNPREKGDLIQKFRANRDADTCISGGFFTKVKTKRTVAAPVCEVQRAHEYKYKYKDKDKVAVAGKCDPTKEAFCNPTVFCVGVKVDDKLRKLADPKKGHPDVIKLFGNDPEKIFKRAADADDSGTKFFQLDYCVESGQDITEKCEKGFMQFLNGERGNFPNNKKSLGESYVACDPAKVKGLAFQDAWNELRASTEKYYQSYCVGGSARDFKQLFCRECEIIAKRIMAMNEKAAGDACGATDASSMGAPMSPGSPEAIPEKEEAL